MLVCVIGLTISCGDDPSLVRESEINLFLRSQAFSDLQINDYSVLDIENTSVHKRGEFNYVMIPVKGSNGLSFVLGKGRDLDFRVASAVTYSTNQTYQETAQSIEVGNFTGEIIMKHSFGLEVSLDFENGELNSEKIKTPTQGKVEGCGRFGSDLWVERVGDCVGRSIESMGTAGRIACFWGIIACVGIEALDCIEAGCPVWA